MAAVRSPSSKSDSSTVREVHRTAAAAVMGRASIVRPVLRMSAHGQRHGKACAIINIPMDSLAMEDSKVAGDAGVTTCSS